MSKFAWFPVRGVTGFIWLRMVTRDGDGILGSTIGTYKMVKLWKGI